MQEQDDILADMIKEMAQQRARTKGFDDSRFRERVEFLGPQISLETLRDSITIRCLEVLGETWDERLNQLKAYQKRFGNCNVPGEFNENPSLGFWVSNQRALYNSGRLA